MMRRYRKRLRRLAVFGISFYVLLSLTFHSSISTLTLSFGLETNQTRITPTGRGSNILENVAEMAENSSVLLRLNKSAITDMVNISKQEVIHANGFKELINFTLPKFNKRRPIVFLHIGKNGGTSFDASMRPVIKKLQGRYMGNKHFDWSYIEKIANSDVVVLLREPVSRAVSHYYFMRKWSRNKLNKGPIVSYISNPKEMLQSRDCWQDGQASVSWLTGTHIASWVGITKSQVPSREQMSLNISEMCILAAKRLESTFWFGIIEDQERSLELLQYQLGWPQKINFRKTNANKHAEANENETRVLASLMPQDIWLYEYAKLLFEARWTYYKTGIYKQPDLPPVPTLETVPCISTRFILLCKQGPLSPLYYVNPSAPVQDQTLPDNVMKGLKLDQYFILNTNISRS